jgi:hypothetical protein
LLALTRVSRSVSPPASRLLKNPLALGLAS